MQIFQNNACIVFRAEIFCCKMTTISVNAGESVGANLGVCCALCHGGGGLTFFSS
jgi:hypothetical protein